VSYTYHEGSNASGYGTYAWSVERRTKLPNRREGLHHKDGRKKQIGDIIKIHDLNDIQAYKSIDEYFGNHIGEGLLFYES